MCSQLCDKKHDMQVLLISILMYNIYFDYAIYEIAKSRKLCIVGALLINLPQNHFIVLAIDLGNESRR